MNKKIHNNKRFLPFILLTCFTLSIVISCKKNNEGAYYGYQNANAEFNGNIYQFLQAQNGLYDSMLYVIDRSTGVKDSLENSTETVFAVPNKCFTIALQNLNQVRALKNLQPISLSQIDSAQLDTLICRYILPVSFNSDSAKFYTNGVLIPSLKYGYKMNLKYERAAASGYLGGGAQQIVYTDPKDTLFNQFWVSTYTTSLNTRTSNGYVHVLSSGHEFGFGEFIIRAKKEQAGNN